MSQRIPMRRAVELLSFKNQSCNEIIGGRGHLGAFGFWAPHVNVMFPKLLLSIISQKVGRIPL